MLISELKADLEQNQCVRLGAVCVSSPLRVVVQGLIEHGEEEISIVFTDAHRRLDPERLRQNGAVREKTERNSTSFRIIAS